MNDGNPLKGLGRRMQHIREKRKVSLDDAAYKMGCSAEDLQKIEAGSIEDGRTWLAQLQRWCDYMGISLAVLLEGQESVPDDALLFDYQYKEAEEQLLSAVAKLEPATTILEVQDLRRLLSAMYDQFRKEQTSGVLAWRRSEVFKLDDFEVRNMLKAVRERRQNPKN